MLSKAIRSEPRFPLQLQNDLLQTGEQSTRFVENVGGVMVFGHFWNNSMLSLQSEMNRPLKNLMISVKSMQLSRMILR